MIILLDIDGVVADFTGAVLDTSLELTHIPRWKSDIKNWHIWDHLGISPADVKRVQDEIAQPGWCSALPIFPGAADFVAALLEQHDVIFVTAPLEGAPCWTYERTDWLKKHFGSVAGSRVIHTAHKALVRGDIMIDDSVSNIREWGRAQEHGLPLLFDAHHNREAKDLFRVSSYMETLAVIDDFAKGILQ